MSGNEYLTGINKVKNKLRMSLYFLQAITLIIFVFVIYYFLSLIPEGVFSLDYVILVIRTVKEIIVLALVVIVYYIIYQSIRKFDPATSVEIYIAVFLSNIAIIFGIDPNYALDANAFYNHIASAFNQPFNLIFGFTSLVFIISSILIIGFIRRGSLESLFTLLIIMYFDLIFLGLFTEVFHIEGVSGFEFTSIINVIRILSTQEILFFVITFILVEFGQVYAFFYSYAKPLSDRLERLIAQLGRVERIVERERMQPRERKLEETKFIEVLSPLAKSIIRDAYEGYAFLGEGTSLYVSAKLKSYVKRMQEKSSDFFESISGVLATPKVITIIMSLLLSFFTKVAIGLIVVVGSTYLLLFVLSRLGGGTIVEMNRVEAYVYVNIALISLIYLAVLIMSFRLKFKRREDIREL